MIKIRLKISFFQRKHKQQQQQQQKRNKISFFTYTNFWLHFLIFNFYNKKSNNEFKKGKQKEKRNEWQ